ncbi:MAG TPA: glycerophosphodiester phosphodiesterase [Mycobacteriales bacterium]|nr:glycerophosphodiester phosphodiesterase [Mycobacteriales bacterium]
MRYAFAHRGGRALGPDNRLATFTTALARGATGLETDAWLTADGEIVLDHDGVHRAGRSRRRPIDQFRRADLPPHIATLEELYDACGVDFDLAIDVKATPVAAAIRRSAAARGALDRLWLVTPAGAKQTAEILQAAAGAHLAVSVRATTLLGPAFGRTLAAAAEAGCSAVNARWPWWSGGRVDLVHQRGLLAFGYDAQRRASLRRCVALGLDGVFSDHVERMLDVAAATS